MFCLVPIIVSPMRVAGGKLSTSWPLLFLALAFGCATRPPHIQVDLSTPGWRVQHGQAVWRPAHGQADLAGELLVAMHPSGGSYLEFTKTPFPLVTAQTAEDLWQIKFGAGERVFTGRGEAPARFAWLHLTRCLAGGDQVPKALIFERNDLGRWRLENRSSGERLEGYVRP